MPSGGIHAKINKLKNNVIKPLKGGRRPLLGASSIAIFGGWFLVV